MEKEREKKRVGGRKRESGREREKDIGIERERES